MLTSRKTFLARGVYETLPYMWCSTTAGRIICQSPTYETYAKLTNIQVKVYLYIMFRVETSNQRHDCTLVGMHRWVIKTMGHSPAYLSQDP